MRKLTSAAILLLWAAVMYLAFNQGPQSREFASNNMVVTAPSVANVYELYRTEGVKGRTLLFFSSDLIVPEGLSLYPETRYLHRAMHEGIIRKVIQVVPEKAWAETAKWALHSPQNYWQTRDGLVGAFEHGRVEFIPLSRFKPVNETALVVVDAAAWTRDDLVRIAGLIRSGDIYSDLIAVVRGLPSDDELFRSER